MQHRVKEAQDPPPSTREFAASDEKENHNAKQVTSSGLSLLFTHHDRFNFHKILGIGCLAHYLLRFFWLGVYGSMFFDRSSWVTWATPFVHMLLSSSSFIFPVPKHRFGSKPIIWKELQLHNVIFVARSAALMLFFLCFPIAEGSDKGVLEHYMTRFIIVASLHYAADVVTENFQDRGRTTTRDIPWDQGTPQWLQRGTKKYYAICQLIATVACLGQTEVLEGAFAIMLPIQLSTFLMTLVRKSLITGTQWHFWYAMSLSLVYMIPIAAMFHERSSDQNLSFSENSAYYKYVKWSLAPVAVIMRLHLRCDKFVIMGLVSAAMIYTTLGMCNDGFEASGLKGLVMPGGGNEFKPNRTINMVAQSIRQYVGASISAPVSGNA